MNVIQLGLFSRQDDKYWWVDQFIWDTRDSEPSTVNRQTEELAFRSLYRQSRLMKKYGVFINLTDYHMQIMRLEAAAMIAKPQPSNVYTWIAARMRGVSHLQIKAILDECSLVVLLRDVLRMPPLAIDWPMEEGRGKKAA